MSGGSFGHDSFKISLFAEDLQNRIDENDKKNDNDSLFSSAKVPEDLLKLIQESQKVIDLAGKLAHDIEWFYSGDIGEDILEKRLKWSLKGGKR